MTQGCIGFSAAGISSGIKKSGDADLGLLVSSSPATVAGVFTRNRVQAAPVILDRERIAAGTCSALLVNSGNANCCNGPLGMTHARAMAAAAARQLKLPESQVLVASTGVIGQPLEVEKIEAAIPELAGRLSPDGFDDLARAIMTTDTVPKRLTRRGEWNGRPFTVTAVAKGAGMIRPDMATLLCFACTDAALEPAVLQSCLQAAVDRSFNRMTIDGDTSTNDTVLLMAGGRSEVSVDSPAAISYFQQILDEVLLELARILVRDGEGVTKLVKIVVRGAQTESDARLAAETVAHSPLVKTAFFGQDANWGRVLAAVGRSGAALDPERIAVYFDRVQMVADGSGCGPQAEKQVAEILQRPEFTVTIDLNLGAAQSSMLTCDFSLQYVRINADYRS